MRYTIINIRTQHKVGWFTTKSGAIEAAKSQTIQTGDGHWVAAIITEVAIHEDKEITIKDYECEQTYKEKYLALKKAVQEL